MVPVVYLRTVDLVTANDHIIALTDYNFMIVPDLPGTAMLAILRTLRDTLTFFSVLIFPVLVTAWYLAREKLATGVSKKVKKKAIKSKNSEVT